MKQFTAACLLVVGFASQGFATPFATVDIEKEFQAIQTEINALVEDSTFTEWGQLNKVMVEWKNQADEDSFKIMVMYQYTANDLDKTLEAITQLYGEPTEVPANAKPYHLIDADKQVVVAQPNPDSFSVVLSGSPEEIDVEQFTTFFKRALQYTHIHGFAPYHHYLITWHVRKGARQISVQLNSINRGDAFVFRDEMLLRFGATTAKVIEDDKYSYHTVDKEQRRLFNFSYGMEQHGQLQLLYEKLA